MLNLIPTVSAWLIVDTRCFAIHVYDKKKYKKYVVTPLCFPVSGMQWQEEDPRFPVVVKTEPTPDLDPTQSSVPEGFSQPGMGSPSAPRVARGARRITQQEGLGRMPHMRRALRGGASPMVSVGSIFTTHRK